MSRVISAEAPSGSRSLPPVLSRLMRGTFWLALRTPLQVVFAFWSIPLMIHAIGDLYGAYGFAWGFGFLQMLMEFGMSSALQRQVSDSWTRGDRAGVDRAIACGMHFYAAMAVIQAAALLAIAYFGVPASFGPQGISLIVKLLWLQAVTAPVYGISAIINSVLQAARRYEIVPRLEMLVVVLRFAILWGGLRLGVDFFLIVVAQTALAIGLTLGPALWVMARELDYLPRFRRARLADFAPLLHISVYMAMIQLSVVLADRIDTTVLGYALTGDPKPGIVVYQAVSKPFFMIRQTSWTLAYLVMPAVASLAAARDERGLERVKYDGPRFLIGLLLPLTLLAWLYAGPFLTLWIGPEMGAHAPLMRLFLVAALPLALSVQVQMAIGLGKIEVIAIAALAGALVNLPLSYLLTRQIGVAGVIWGTVLTTLLSNLLVPGVYLFRVLGIRVRTFLARTLSAPLSGAATLLAATWALRSAFSADPRIAEVVARSLPLLVRLSGGHQVIADLLVEASRAVPLLAHLGLGCLAFLAGYLAMPTGRADLSALARKICPRRAAA
ncbi:MAG: polysaccharide biosynthesis C-terminal domain-containing protein [Isosphaeraceae bacterium]|nr:polysaccharide biosynthesis C-terminal domain-containing protein [Isosphaeraceae bacterium]